VADDWQLLQFIERLDEWAAREDPSEDLRVIVANWVINLHSNPYADLKPQRGFPACGSAASRKPPTGTHWSPARHGSTRSSAP
jgi:hypothetical protein